METIAQAINRAIHKQDLRAGTAYMNQATYDALARHLEANRNPFLGGIRLQFAMFALAVDESLGDNEFRFEGGAP